MRLEVATLRWLGLAVLASLLVRLPFLRLPMISDEGGYAYVAQRWFDGRGQLYHDIWVSRPQGIFVAYGTIMSTLGGSVEAIRLGAWFFAAGTVIVTWFIARELFDTRVANLAAMLCAVIGGSPSIEGFTANAEVFMAFPAALAAWATLRACRRGWPGHLLILIGVLAAVSMLLKPSGFVMLAVAGGMLWFSSAMVPNRILARRYGWLGLGFLLGMLPSVIHGLFLGWSEYVFASLTYRLSFQSSATVGIGHHLRAIFWLGWRISPLLLLTLVLGVLWLSLDPRIPRAGLAPSPIQQFGRIGTGFLPQIRPKQVSPGWEVRALLALWLVSCGIGIAMGGDWWYHYIIQIVAPFSIWLAMMLVSLVRRSDTRQQVALVAATVLALLLPFGVLAKGSADSISIELFNHSGYPEQDAVAAYLRTHSAPETPIFAAFDEAALYYLADRPATYRYMYDQELRAIPNAYGNLLAMLLSPNRPLYIVGTKQRPPFSDQGKQFWWAVADHYHLETIVDGVPIYRANSWDSRVPQDRP